MTNEALMYRFLRLEIFFFRETISSSVVNMAMWLCWEHAGDPMTCAKCGELVLRVGECDCESK